MSELYSKCKFSCIHRSIVLNDKHQYEVRCSHKKNIIPGLNHGRCREERCPLYEKRVKVSDNVE